MMTKILKYFSMTSYQHLENLKNGDFALNDSEEKSEDVMITDRELYFDEN